MLWSPPTTKLFHCYFIAAILLLLRIVMSILDMQDSWYVTFQVGCNQQVENCWSRFEWVWEGGHCQRGLSGGALPWIWMVLSHSLESNGTRVWGSLIKNLSSLLPGCHLANCPEISSSYDRTKPLRSWAKSQRFGQSIKPQLTHGYFNYGLPSNS